MVAGIVEGRTVNCRNTVMMAALLTGMATASAGAATVSFTTAHKFSSVDGGGIENSYGGLVADPTGVLYGTTKDGGPNKMGGVFALTPPAPGTTTWTETTLWTFSGADGANPYAGLVRGANGVLYGTTAAGGTANDGTVFSLTPPAAGQTQWTETVLWSFAGGSDGADPYGALIIDPVTGALYGTTEDGGKMLKACHGGCGTVFALTPPAAGQTQWTKSTIWSFADGTDGYHPYAGVVEDANGVLYGTTVLNAQGYGSVFSLKPSGAAWTESTLYVFPFASDPSAGSEPYGGVILGPNGVLYGATKLGAFTGGGVAYSLTPPALGGGQWTYTMLANLTDRPMGPLAMDASGNLYGTGEQGATGGDGTVFELTPPALGQTEWTETELWNFAAASGANPYGGLLESTPGTFYGTTEKGGTTQAGTVFAITP